MGLRIVLGRGPDRSAEWLGELLQSWEESRCGEVEVVVADGAHLDDAVSEGLEVSDGVVVAPGDWSELEAISGSGLPARRIVVVGIDDADADGAGAAAAFGLPVIRGRGLEGFRWAIRWLTQRLAYPFEQMSYGVTPDQIADLRLPAVGEPPFPVAVLLHGGFWRERWVRDTIEPLAIDLAGRGLATWNVEYRRVGRRHGGWSETSRDVASALAALRPLEESLDLSRIVVIGHSAGAQLAGWAAARRDVDGSEAAVRPAALVLLAGVMDLAECARRALGDNGNAAVSLMGGDPTELGDAYRQASPSANLPLGVPQIVVQGRRDSPDLTDMAREYVRAARAAGDEVVYHESAEADHFTVITPSSDEWHWTVGEIRRFLDC